MLEEDFGGRLCHVVLQSDEQFVDEGGETVNERKKPTGNKKVKEARC